METGEWKQSSAAATVRRKNRCRSFNELEMETSSYRHTGYSGYGPTAGKMRSILGMQSFADRRASFCRSIPSVTRHGIDRLMNGDCS